MLFHSDSLREYLESEPIEVADFSVKHPIPQDSLIPDSICSYTQRTYNQISSFYYELLASAITGGKWRGKVNSSYGSWGFFPDVVTEDSVIDSKGVCGKEKCALLDMQMDRYLLQQCRQTFMPQEKVRYFIFKYGIRSPSKRFSSTPDSSLATEVISALSRETLFLLDLPFSVLHSFRSNAFNSLYTSGYNGDKWDNGTVILHTGLLKMISSPEEVLEGLHLNPADFNIIKSRLPEGMSANGIEILPYPVLRIEDKYYNEWLEKLRENNAERLDLLEKERKTRDEYRRKAPKRKLSSEGIKELF
jgi:hypothetical protein